ncbi:MAG: hypothetical protein ACE5I2_06580 [Anaerolineae bacterium]
MSNTNNEPQGHASQFTPFEWGTIILLAGLANASTFLEELLARTLNASAVTSVIPDKPINYLLWGLTVALALRIAKRDGTATLYMTITGMVFAVVQPAGILWACGFVLAGVVIDTYMSGRRALALAEVAILTVVASMVNRSPELQRLLSSATLDLRGLLGIEVPFFALMLIVILASLFGAFAFPVFEPADRGIRPQSVRYHGRRHPATVHRGSGHAVDPDSDRGRDHPRDADGIPCPHRLHPVQQHAGRRPGLWHRRAGASPVGFGLIGIRSDTSSPQPL